MDVDAYVMANKPTWDRLEALVKRRKVLTGAEVDELVDLYQRTATHLSVLRTNSPDPHVVGRLTVLVARARSSAGDARAVSYQSLGHYFLRVFPAQAWRARWWWLGAAASVLLLSGIEATWIITSPTVQNELLTKTQIAALEENFVGYYHDNAHGSFFAKVWTNNALIGVGSLVAGFTFIAPIYLLLLTAIDQLGPAAGYLIAEGQGTLFFEYILPHGLLELSAVFLAAGSGLRLGWTLIAPGATRTRIDALAEEGRSTVAMAGGIVVMLLMSGLLEGFITPSGFPAAVRVGIGAAVWVVVVGGILVLGRRAVRAGVSADLSAELAGSIDRTV